MTKVEKSAVVILMKIYLDILDILEKLEELEHIKLYDEVKSRNEPSICLDEYRQQRLKRKQHASTKVVVAPRYSLKSQSHQS